jgi:Tol biopolymer transport system component
MRFRVVGAWGFVLAGVVAAACSGKEDPLSCGAGTVLKGNECVAAGASGAGGDAQCGEGPCGAAGAAANGGASPLEGGAPNGGAVMVDGGAGGAGAGAGGGAGMESLGGAGAAGADNRPRTRWLAFEHEDGAFAYDVTKFPDQDALLQLSTGSLGSWSPDGRKLLFSKQNAWYVRDMSSATPEPAVLLLESQLTPRLTWSADSTSIAMVQGTTLSVFDPSEAAPSLQPLTTTLLGYQWAPVGNKLVYVDASGGHVVQVVAGVPGSSVAIASRAMGWAPHGNALAGNKNDGTLTLTTLDGDPPTLTTLFEPTGPGTGMEGFIFNPDGSRLATTGWQDRAESDAFYVNLLPTPGTLSTPYAPLANDVVAASIGWSPNGEWLLYESSDNVAGTDQYFAVNVAGESPGTPVPLDVHSLHNPLWLPGGLKLITDTGPATVAIIDLLDPAQPEPLLNGVSLSSCALNPRGTVLGYRSPYALHLLDLSAPEQPAVDINFQAGNVGKWSWSPDGNFIAVVTLTNKDQTRLVRIDDDLGTSSPISLGDGSSDAISLRWQP